MLLLLSVLLKLENICLCHKRFRIVSSNYYFSFNCMVNNRIFSLKVIRNGHIKKLIYSQNNYLQSAGSIISKKII